MASSFGAFNFISISLIFNYDHVTLFLMQKNILITGKPKSGKSTLLKGLITDIPNKTGFVTNEILGESGRVGFEIGTRTGRRTMLARVDSETPCSFPNIS